MSSKSLKIIIVGDRGVGKTSLIQKYVNGAFDEKSSRQKIDDDDDDTLTADFLEKRVIVDEKEVTVSLWDQPATITPPPRSFFAGTHGCCLVFSTTDSESLQKLEFWYESLKQFFADERCKHPPVVISENKIDLIDRSVVDAEMVEKAAKQYKLRLYRTSAKRGHQVDELFDYITAKAAKYESEQKIAVEESDEPKEGQKTKAGRTLSTASWTLPTSSSDDRLSGPTEPSKRRTAGIKTINRSKCPVM